MRELIGQVAATDGDVATALRVIAHFDTLVDKSASTAAVLRAAAALAEASVGLHDTATGRTTRVDARGVPAPESDAGEDPAWPRVSVDREHTSTVWLERRGEPRPLDRLIVERCAHALRVRMGGAELLTTKHLVRTACDGEVTDAEREAALQALRLSAPVSLSVAPANAVLTSRACTVIDGTWVALGSSGRPVDPQIGQKVRLGRAQLVGSDAHRALERARLALALAVDPAHGGPARVSFEELGALGTIAAALSPHEAGLDPDVSHLEMLRAQRPWVPLVFSRMVSGRSARETARDLHLHHSSLQDRVKWLEQALGYSPRTPTGHHRAASAWALWRVSGHLH